MFIIKTTTGETIHIDTDELQKLNEAKMDAFVWFRQGGVLKRLVGVILKDEERIKNTPRIAGFTEEDARKRAEALKSEDIFKHVRPKLLGKG